MCMCASLHGCNTKAKVKMRHSGKEGRAEVVELRALKTPVKLSVIGVSQPKQAV